MATLQGSDAYQALSAQERQVLDRYSELQLGGTLKGQTVRDITGIQDQELGREYGGAGTVDQAAKALYTDGVELEFFIRERPYLFFANPDSGEFYFLKNTNLLDPLNTDIEVLEVRTGQWVNVDDPTQLFGDPDKGTSENYPGLVKANFVVTQFNKDAGRVFQERDRIQLRVPEESLGPKNRDELYYHEKQKDGLCQMHAANAFLGYAAIRPNALAEYMAGGPQEFNPQHVEGLAAGGQGFEAIAEELGNGIDLGSAVGYMQHLAAEGELRVDITNLQLGELNYSDETGLIFTNFATQEAHRVDAEFLNRNSRAMVGTLRPVHAIATRKNTDGSWSNVDSFYEKQAVQENFEVALIEKVKDQKGFVDNDALALPCVFL